MAYNAKSSAREKTVNISILQGRLVDPKHQIDAHQDIFLAGGRIAGLGQAPEGFVAEREIDASGLVVAPGLIDLSAQLTPLACELRAAVAGGVSTVISSPELSPILDEPELAERLTRNAADQKLARLLPLGALTQGLEGQRLTEMAGLTRAGCVAFSQGKHPMLDTQALLRAFEYAATFGFSVWLQPQDYYLARNGFAHDGEVCARLGLTGIPVSAETIAIATCLTLAADTGVRLHLHGISSARGMEMIAQAQTKGIAVSCDTTIHHLHLSEDDIGFFDTNARFDPPLRSRDDRAALRQGVLVGVAALCSDHTPLNQDDKRLPFGEASPGATGLELLLPLTLKWAIETQLSLNEALAPITSHPAAILGRDDLGHLGIGARADLCLFAPVETWQVTPERLESRGKNTPFIGQEMRGRVKYTLVDGAVVFGD
ncbi:MAG: dihydroorotase [Zoogloeaceae bacterium]|jgi:dihydroorotase|nr:dihydroorotase [Zoogloeaceae bacterium]